MVHLCSSFFASVKCDNRCLCNNYNARTGIIHSQFTRRIYTLYPSIRIALLCAFGIHALASIYCCRRRRRDIIIVILLSWNFRLDYYHSHMCTVCTLHTWCIFDFCVGRCVIISRMQRSLCDWMELNKLLLSYVPIVDARPLNAHADCRAFGMRMSDDKRWWWKCPNACPTLSTCMHLVVVDAVIASDGLHLRSKYCFIHSFIYVWMGKYK